MPEPDSEPDGGLTPVSGVMSFASAGAAERASAAAMAMARSAKALIENNVFLTSGEKVKVVCTYSVKLLKQSIHRILCKRQWIYFACPIN